MAEHERGESPCSGGDREVLAALPAPGIESERRQPLEHSGRTGSGQQESEDRDPEMRGEGDEESGERNCLRLNAIEGQA